MALCSPCHAQTDAPYRRGRLLITALGDGRFTCQVIRGADKMGSPRVVGQISGPSRVDVYEVLRCDVDAFDAAPCRLPVVRALRWPLCVVLGRADAAAWNDTLCPDAPAAEQLLRAAARRAIARARPVGRA
ncbi:MAG TPA: hypothetical protein VJX71_21350 [Methylomirabilota bacterium]|nr:hypothetical protein [Methylomirabilota bacterium]